MQAAKFLWGRRRRFCLVQTIAVGRNGLCVESLAHGAIAFGDSCLRQPGVQLAQLDKGRWGRAGSGGLLGRLDLLKHGGMNGLKHNRVWRVAIVQPFERRIGRYSWRRVGPILGFCTQPAVRRHAGGWAEIHAHADRAQPLIQIGRRVAHLWQAAIRDRRRVVQHECHRLVRLHRYVYGQGAIGLRRRC